MSQHTRQLKRAASDLEGLADLIISGRQDPSESYDQLKSIAADILDIVRKLERGER